MMARCSWSFGVVAVALSVLLLACTTPTAVSADRSSSQSAPETFLLESSSQSRAVASAETEESLRVPTTPDMTCVALQSNKYVSSACPNANWTTYSWIQTQAAGRLLDYQLDSLFAGARTNSAGTRRCRDWYRDIMCRYVFPKCSTSGGQQGGPCQSECEQFALSCPGLAMSCAAFDSTTTTPAGVCWTSKTRYVYGRSNSAVSHTRHATAAAVLLSGITAWALATLW